jgi:hypothetical protein
LIEVKGMRGPWTRQGVALSRRQFEAAQQYGDRYWLYVVEFADDPARARIHPIHNPFARITQFFFDSGWRQLADPAESPSATCQLTVGQRIAVANVGKGEVIAYLYTPPSSGDGCHVHFHLMVDGRKGFLAPAMFTPEVVRAFHKQCRGFKDSNDGKPIPPCMGYLLGAEENPFGDGPKDEL